MPWAGAAGSQTFSRTDGTRTGQQTWQQADAAGVDIIATDHDTHDQDIANAINATLKKDGGNSATSDIPFGGFRLKNLGEAVARTDSARLADIQDGKGVYIPTVGGSANAITLTSGYSVTAYAAGQTFRFIAASTNSGAVTIALDGLAAKDVKVALAALTAGMITAGQMITATYDGTQFQMQAESPASIGVGSIVAWATSTIPAGWLECTGAAISRSTYSALFAAIGTTYGSGDGSTTFNLPDYRGYFLRGQDGGSANDPNAATRTNRGDGTTGDNVGTKQGSDYLSHTHTGTTSSNGAHTHTYTAPASAAGGDGGSSVIDSSTPGTPTSSDGAHTHTFTTAASPTSGGSETRPKNVNVKWIILAIPAASVGSTAIDASSVAFTQAGTGAVERTTQNKLRDEVSLFDFIPESLITGIVLRTSTDDVSSYVQAAFDAAYRVTAPAGKYYLGNTNISVSDKAFMLEGAGMGVTFFQWNGSSGGITYNQNNGVLPMGVRDLSLFQEGAAVGTALHYDGSDQISDGTIAARTYPRLTVENVNIRGSSSAAANAWDICIQGTSLMRAVFDKVHMQGMFSGTQDNILSSYGIYLTGPGAAVESIVTNCWAYYVVTAVEAEVYEGLFVSNCNFVHVYTGVFYNDTGGGPQIAVMNNHINAYECGIDGVGLNQASIQGNLIYSRSNSPGTVYGIRLRDGSSLNSVIGNTFVNTGGVTFIPVQVGDGTGSAGSILRNGIHHNIFWGHASFSSDVPIHIGSDASTTQISGNNYHTWGAAKISDSGTGTRRWGEDDLTTVFAGTPQTLVNNTDSAVNIGLYVDSDRATPTDNDRVGIGLRLSDDTGVQTEFARVEAIATDVSNTTEDGALRVHVMIGGTLTHRYTLGATDISPNNDNLVSLGRSGVGLTGGYFSTGAILDFGNSNWRATHSSGVLNVSTGSLQIGGATVAVLGTEDQTLTGGVRVTSKDLGTTSTGTLTPDPGDRPLQHTVNGGAFTLAPGSNTGSYLLDITNNGSAGAITTSGWTKVTGDPFTTTNGHKFRCVCSIANGGSLLSVQALQ